MEQSHQSEADGRLSSQESFRYSWNATEFYPEPGECCPHLRTPFSHCPSIYSFGYK